MTRATLLLPVLVPLFVLALLVPAGCGSDDGGAGDEADAVDATDVTGGDAAQDVADTGPDAADADAGPDLEAEREAIRAVPETERWTLPGLSAPVHVVRTEMGVPHVYASTREDLGRALGFVVARDRFFVMDLQRRLAQGTVSALLGDVGLESDLDSRLTGMHVVADRVLAGLNEEMAAYLDAYAAGINAYVEQVAAGELPPPSEVDLAAPLLGAEDAASLMEPFDRRDVAAMIAVIMYETTFEGGDPKRAQKYAALDGGLFEGAAFEDLRQAGAVEDIWWRLDPPFEALSTAAWPGQGEGNTATAAGGMARAPAGTGRAALPAASMLERTVARLDRRKIVLGRREAENFGSNVWAVAGDRTTDGAALVAGDGHLPLYVPSIMYQVGMDTRVFGEGGGFSQAGLLITSLPLLAVGTNGDVAWSQVNPVSDTVDWYSEEIALDAGGMPESSRFQGEWKPLERVEETYEIADVPALDSVGRTETWDRFVTFDGRMLFDIEGTPVDGEAPEGAYVTNVGGRRVIPGDVDGDGVVSAVSFDYTAFDTEAYPAALDAFGHAEDVRDLQEATKGFVGNLLFTGAADKDGHIFYTAYQGVPCRGYLDRDAQGRWLPDADPTLLLDGTRYGGFTIPTGPDGKVDEAPGQEDPYRCVVPFEETPQAVDPPQGYVVSANNQPAPIHEDGTLYDDPWYIGGPWSSVRANTIAGALEDAIAEGTADEAKMAEIQANKRSRLAELFVPALLEAVSTGRALAASDEDLTGWELRLAELYGANEARFEEAASRLEAWQDRGLWAASGVDSFYHVSTDDGRADSVATMIFNAWLPRAIGAVFGDEDMRDAWRFNGSRARFHALDRFLRGRGEDGSDLASWNPETGESVFFDVRGTAEVERSREVLLQGLVETLDWLESEPTGPAAGGFGTDDMSAWRWGLRHRVKFESVIADYLPTDSELGFIADLFSITTETLPLADDMQAEDPRRDLKWFPRGGDNYTVDAASPGFGGTNFDYGSGPVMRMVIALDEDGVRGRNIVPGGQSGLTDSDHFADQAELWLGNQTIPLRFHVDQVVEGATGREVLEP
ncbi:MAG: penicillin acylase family protein [Myxococcota bacterium]